MICFPNVKINIGLRVLEKRPDGFHSIESIFYPASWCDVLEVIAGGGGFDLSLDGLEINGDKKNNLCTKAYLLLKDKYQVPDVKVALLKNIPTGAGLGGGSSDAAFLLKLLNDYFSLNIDKNELKAIASLIGSDCAFFIDNKPSYVTGKGDILSPASLDLSNYFIAVIFPNLHIETSLAYSLVTPLKRNDNLQQLVSALDINEWKDQVVNDFELPIFNLYPQLKEIKRLLYDNGALYASMTGSGSAMYGIFNHKPEFGDLFSEYRVWIGKGSLTQ